MRTRVKICGITTPAVLVAALDAGAEHVGLNFFGPSPRAISPDVAAGFAGRAPHLSKVGLFVDADDALIDAAVARGRLDALQLQGAETPERVAGLRARHGIPVWRAIGVRTSDDIAAAERRFAGADLLLLDARPPDGALLPGGNGLRFDWAILTARRPAMPWGLAGGLTPDTVADAIRATHAPLVDVASGVEDAPGAKNLAKIAAFVKAARHA